MIALVFYFNIPVFLLSKQHPYHCSHRFHNDGLPDPEADAQTNELKIVLKSL